MTTIYPELPHEDPTTWMQDFYIANMFGAKAIKDTYNTAVKEWKSDAVMMTWLCVALNHWSWIMYEHHKPELSELYADLYYKCKDKFYKVHEKDKDACRYFFEITD